MVGPRDKRVGDVVRLFYSEGPVSSRYAEPLTASPGPACAGREDGVGLVFGFALAFAAVFFLEGAEVSRLDFTAVFRFGFVRAFC